MMASSLELVFNHLVLPPKLPGSRDAHVEKIESQIITRLLDAAAVLSDLSSGRSAEAWGHLRRSLEICRVVNDDGRLNKTTLLNAFRGFQTKDGLILHVSEQNAGILIRHTDDDYVIFETFEASPASEQVLKSGNALKCDFPGSAASIPVSEFVNSSFQESFASFLEQASVELIQPFAARSRKAGISVVETRDTVDPSLITQMLVTLVEANGRREYPQQLRKRVRDDVCWNDAEFPWRRCAYWLVLRVSVQRFLWFTLGAEVGRVHYKFLICIMLARLLVDCLDHLGPELCDFLKAKLCRRLAKLEVERAESKVPDVYTQMFIATEPLLEDAILKAAKHVDATWAAFKHAAQRRIPFLPLRADDNDLLLCLPNSRLRLEEILQQPLYPKELTASASNSVYLNSDVAKGAIKPFNLFADRYYSLTDTEMGIESGGLQPPSGATGHEESCIWFSKTIEKYMENASDAYFSSPEQMSIFILNLFDLWVSMDTCATNAIPLLHDYHPGFDPSSLDVLQLALLQDLRRLKDIQTYLKVRCERCKPPKITIFSDPTKGCFAARYFNESDHGSRLHQLLGTIESASKSARLRKEKEWEDKKKQHDKLCGEISSCVCTGLCHEDGTHDIRGCRHCFLVRRRRRLQIGIHEDYLPSDTVQKQVVIFELDVPKSFIEYRETTWNILTKFRHPENTITSASPKTSLKEYTQLKCFIKSTSSRFVLTSTTKSFLVAHYKHYRLPTPINKIVLPLGLKFSYYDNMNKLWSKDLRKWPTFAPHCGMAVGSKNPFYPILKCPDFAPNASGPSSYQVIASQTQCPPELTVQEFMAYQNLFSGRNRRWLSMLVELGSSNLNFSAETTMLLFSQLALQAGPPAGNNILRAVHTVFEDRNFCGRLVEQIGQRLHAISDNWREFYCMEGLLTLVLRLYALQPGEILEEVIKLLDRVREITLQWIFRLRDEVRIAREADAAERATGYGFSAALICRRTFIIHADKNDALDSESLTSFIKASIALQENLIIDANKVSGTLRNMLIRDVKMAYRMRSIIRKSIEIHSDSLTSAINGAWPEAEGGLRTYSEWKFLQKPYQWWVTSTVGGTEFTAQQVVHYSLLEGHLLIDGKPLGKLPAEIRNSKILMRLFGNQQLLTYPSSMRGMTYVLAALQKGHQIHIGFRNKELLVRAIIDNTLLEFVDRGVFQRGAKLDLPSPLVHECVHWLNLGTGCIDIRREQYAWKYNRNGNWVLNLQTGRANRRLSQLVDPHSGLFKTVAAIFKHFEHPHMLTVYQPERGNLSVELKRLDLDFYVNRNGLLASKQLHSVVDLNQDAGAWYGLDSKLVLRDSRNKHQRSVIVPIGPLVCERRGVHVAVRVEHTGNYGRYAIDDVLGRLQCPVEPFLLYLKAQLHAFTSFVLPDPLTGKTGTEEALYCLQSAYCQPWTPLSDDELQLLGCISKLTPTRHYYPQGLKCQQTVLWDPMLTSTMQHESYRKFVDDIVSKSERFTVFVSGETEKAAALDNSDITHLCERGYWRRHPYERSVISCHKEKPPSDLFYQPRDHQLSANRNDNVFEIANLLLQRPVFIRTSGDLANTLQGWPVIAGYDREFRNPCLTDLVRLGFALEWGPLVNSCRNSEPEEKYSLMFQLCIVAFGQDVDMNIVRTLVAFSVFEELRVLQPPIYPYFTNFRLNEQPTYAMLLQLVENCYEDKSSKTESLHMDDEEYGRACEIDGRAFVSRLLGRWPCGESPVRELVSGTINPEKAIEVITPEWLRLFQNLEHSRYIEQVQKVLNLHQAKPSGRVPQIRNVEQCFFELRRGDPEVPTLSRDLLSKINPMLDSYHGPDVFGGLQQNSGSRNTTHVSSRMLTQGHESDGISPSPEIRALETIIKGIIDSQSPIRKQYGKDLKQSLDALKTRKYAPQALPQAPPTYNLNKLIDGAWRRVRDWFDLICNAIAYNDPRFRWLRHGNLWPCITYITLLEQLRSSSKQTLRERIKQTLISFAISITTLQHLLRMMDAECRNDYRKLREEQQNPGHSNWEPSRYPDWLLLEIDADILIRSEQVDVALATISPGSGSNSVLQMNMGQGKTSCIMPMVAAVLADGKHLTRLIVPKALLLQTAQILQSRLGGLIGREIRHIPFSRKTPTRPEIINEYHDIHRDLLMSSGIILALPEHALSFMLSGLQRLSDSRTKEARQMIQVQSWLNRTCRDILDECDFTLAVKTQLIYPSGSLLTVDGHPHRWETAQVLLNLVESHLWNLRRDFPKSIEVVKRTSEAFPVVYILRQDIEDALNARLIDDIVSGRTVILPTEACSEKEQHAIRSFISNRILDDEAIELATSAFPDKPAAATNLYLLRGLLVHGILLLCLKKRWNVQYGLHPNRDPLAVPFHAKGVPSEQAEWGHPDVAIVLTCLAFYYSGLNMDQLRQALQQILRSDDPSSEYDRWTNSAATLPESLRHWNLINVDDDGQISEIWRHLRFTIITINYYLNSFVFPVHAKQFLVKLQASGWDIPLFSPCSQTLNATGGSDSRSLTTGFSGTNDNRRMLPLTIRQEDLPGLSHTNAEVLAYLLQRRNRRYVLAANPNGKRLSETQLLTTLYKMDIRVLIDAGAHILEMDNKSLARAWLDIDHEARAAVYFNADKAFVLYRNNKIVPLLASSFSESLDNCLVYLDEAHTRGTDLKFPPHTCGGLTLSLGQTKDHTVQAAMRLRQLGSTQSIVFFSPPEVNQSILHLCRKSTDRLESYDVVRWLLEQTCTSNEQLQQLYFAQGADFCYRTHAAAKYSNFLTDPDHRALYFKVLRKTEQRTLKQLYKPTLDTKYPVHMESLGPQLDGFMEELKGLRISQGNNATFNNTAFEEVEQEREVAYEVEEIRAVQKPAHFKALTFPGLHPDIKRFATTGEFIKSQGYGPALMALGRTALGMRYKVDKTEMLSHLYVSTEFMRTVELKSNQTDDNFLRPVNWILWSSPTQKALIIIPEEAEALIPSMRTALQPKTHMLLYSSPVTKKMLHFNNLLYYSLPALSPHWKAPSWLTIELGFFAGRLYFEFAEYEALLRYLGTGDSGDISGARKRNDVPRNAITDSIEKPTTKREKEPTDVQIPLTFLQEWLAVRRQGHDFNHTPMGYVCQGLQLRADHPFFQENRIELPDSAAGSSANVERDDLARSSRPPIRFAPKSQGAADINESDESADSEEDEYYSENEEGNNLDTLTPADGDGGGDGSAEASNSNGGIATASSHRLGGGTEGVEDGDEVKDDTYMLYD